MPVIDALKTILETIFHYLEYILVVPFLVVGIGVAVHHGYEMAKDYFERFGDVERRYRVRSTIVKDMLGDHQSQTAKLRRLRVSRNHVKLILDPWPNIVPIDTKKERPAKLSHFYSVPGRLGIENDQATNEKKFVIILGRDEELKKHQEYSTLLGYTLNEEIEEILTPPGFIAVQPVGKSCFTYEVHFPPNRKFVRNKNLADPYSNEEPRIKVYKEIDDKEHELSYESYGWTDKGLLVRLWTRFKNISRTRYHVIGGRADFGDGHDTHDWFRVTILNPPQDKEIRICWCMQNDPAWGGFCSHTEEEHKPAEKLETKEEHKPAEQHATKEELKPAEHHEDEGRAQVR
jgi:hypothetical protein